MEQECISSFAGKFDTRTVLQCWTFRLEYLREVSTNHSHGSRYSDRSINMLSLLSEHHLRNLTAQPYRCRVYLTLWSKKNLPIFFLFKYDIYISL